MKYVKTGSQLNAATVTDGLLRSRIVKVHFVTQYATNVSTSGKAKERIGNGRQYSIEWTDGSTCVQKAIFIFGPFSKRQKLTNGDYVLAMAVEPDQILFKPGVIKDGSVEFYSSSEYVCYVEIVT